MQLARDRADSCLMEAAVEISAQCETDIDFSDFDKEERAFAEGLTREEKYLLARLQYQRYLYRDFSTLRAQATRFTSAEQNVFSPANDRRTFLQMYDGIMADNEKLLAGYLCRDRLTGKRKTLSYDEV